MRMRRFLTISAAAVFLVLSGAAARAQFQRNAMCPVMPGHAVKEKFYVDYQGDRIFFCCRSCLKAFQKHPERFLKNLPRA